MRLLFGAESFKTSDYRGMVDEVRQDTRALEQVVYLGTDDWTAFVEAGADQPEDAVARRGWARSEPGDPINIQYTSGTTGFPKGATLSHRNILNNGYFVTETINFTEQDRLAIPVPFYHCFGMVMGNLGCTTHGACMVIPAPGFDPAITLQAVQDERCTGVYGVPTMFIAMQNAAGFADYDLSSLRTGIMAGSHLPGRGDEALRQRHAHGGGVDRLRHDRDVSGVDARPAATTTSTGVRRPSGACTRTSRSRSSTRPPVRPSSAARPASSAPAATRVMLGYWDDAGEDDEAIDTDGWMHTGDLAVMREDGYCNIVGRIKDMVIRGGENIYPREIEEFLYTHPDIEDVQVVGVPDEKYGEELCAWVTHARAAPSRWMPARCGSSPGQAGSLQDPALRHGGRRVPDDGDRQDPEGRRCARSRHDEARALVNPAESSADPADELDQLAEDYHDHRSATRPRGRT